MARGENIYMDKYFEALHKNYKITRVLIYSIFLTTFFLYADFFNILSKYFNSKIMYWGIIACVLVLILIAMELKAYELFKLTQVNTVDVLLLISSISCFLYISIADTFFSPLYEWKKAVNVIVITLCVLVILYRKLTFENKIEKLNSYKTNFVDLKDLYESNINLNKSSMIFMNEKDVEYDLLERDIIINHLFEVIRQSIPENNFVVSLEGSWGSGKTTIINNVKKKLLESESQIIIIDKFDPWIYKDQKSLLMNMLDVILKKSGFNYSLLNSNKVIESMAKSVFGINKSFSLFKPLLYNINEIEGIKEKINDHLRISEKKIVFFIDNIDRIESENIILLFNLVGNTLDFERITYVLSFDNDRVKKIFDNNPNLDYQYLKKIIQYQIVVPEIDKENLTKILQKCICNVFEVHDKDYDTCYHNSTIKLICEKLEDLRDFKRFVNSVVNSVFWGNEYLNKRDMLAIEFIRLYSLNLYRNIYKNRQFYITYDITIDRDSAAYTRDKKKFNEDGKKYFDDLFEVEEYLEYQRILAELFPYVKRYIAGGDLVNPGPFNAKESSEIVKQKSISNFRYFSLYFTKTDNAYSVVGGSVEKLIDVINRRQNFDEIKSTFNEIFKDFGPEFHLEIFKIFQIHLEDLSEDVFPDLIQILFDKVNFIDASYHLYENAKQKVEFIIWELLRKLSDEQYDSILSIFDQKYGKIGSISNIVRFFEYYSDESTSKKKEKFLEIYDKICNDILSKSIDLYEDPYYGHTNILGLYKHSEQQQMRKEYIEKILNKENIFRFIYDVTNISYGSCGFGYSILRADLVWIASEDLVDEILNQAVPKTDDEKFVLDIYMNHKADTWLPSKDIGLFFDKEKKIKL